MKAIVFLLLLIGTTVPLMSMEEVFKAEAEWQDRREEYCFGVSKRVINCVCGVACIAGGLMRLWENRQNITVHDIGISGAYFAAGLACFSKNDLFLHREDPDVVQKLKTLWYQASTKIGLPKDRGKFIINSICFDRVIAFPKEELQKLYDRSRTVSCTLKSKKLEKWDTIKDIAKDYYF